MVIKRAKHDPNGIKIAIFLKNYKIFQKISHSLRQLGTPPSDPGLWYVWVTIVSSSRLHSKI